MGLHGGSYDADNSPAMEPHLKYLKPAIAFLVLAVALALAAGAIAVALGERKLARSVEVRVVPVPYATGAAAMKLGKYLFDSRGCAECHGADGAGRVLIEDADGLHVKTPDITRGAGGVVAGYEPADWVRAIRHGVDPKGRALMIMPSEDYSRLNDDDFAALVAYARALPPVAGSGADIRLPTVLKALYGTGLLRDASEKIDHRLPPAAPVAVAATVEHGEYVANMCVGCHGPTFSGGRIPGTPPDWPPAANLTPGEGGVMQRYPDAASFAAMMRTGRRGDGSTVSRVMPFTSLATLTDVDLEAMRAYFATLPPRKAGGR
jgi:mono/diheme cytochrome c family protein